MARSTSEKEKFFAHLESLDGTESEEDNSTEALEEAARKRRKIDHKPVKPTLQKSVTLPTESAEQTFKNAVPSLTRAATDLPASTKKDTRQFAGASAVDLTVDYGTPAVFATKPNARETINPELTRSSAKQSTRRSKAGKGDRPTTAYASELGVKQTSTPGLFEGMKFCPSSLLLLAGPTNQWLDFIPNDDVHKVRKLRIQGAIAQGATWVRQPDESITHIIVDADISAAAVAKFLKDEVDTSKVAIVKDKWLIESLGYKHVRDTNQGRFQLQGASEVFTGPKALEAEKVANPAAVTKPAHPVRRSNRVRRPAPRGPGDLVLTIDSASPARRKERHKPTEQPAQNTTDDLSAILQEMQNAAHPPFDDELDLLKFVSFNSTPTSTFKLIPPENKGSQCMEAHIGHDDNPNARTIGILQKLATYYDWTGDNWRILAYRKAITALRKQPTLVKNAKQAQSIKGIGSRLADKIEEIVTTDRLQRYEKTLDDPNDQALQLFMGIYDVGYQQAQLWISQGYRTLDDLKGHGKLTPNQQIGTEHYDDFQQRIPREEVTEHGRIVAKALKRANNDLEGIIGGSYRRGNKDSSDIDVVITHPKADLQQLRAWVFDKVVPYLFEIGFLKCTLATSRSHGKQMQASPSKERAVADPQFSGSHDTGTKFHGASALTADSPWRRIDLLLTPHTEVGAAMIYFTGNDIFNRSLRLLASRKGMRLNQRGLYKDVMRAKDRTKITGGELVEGKSERRIFDVLGVPWREPWERKC